MIYIRAKLFLFLLIIIIKKNGILNPRNKKLGVSLKNKKWWDARWIIRF